MRGPAPGLIGDEPPRHAGNALTAAPPTPRSRTGPLPEGTLVVGSGLLVLGLTAYVYFVISARALGPTRYAGVSVLWTLVFFAAPGFLFPIEQEVSRAVSSRRATGTGGWPVVRRAAVLGGGLAGTLALVALVTAPLSLSHLFDGNSVLVAALVVSIPVYAAIHLTRGVLSGSSRFRSYAALLAGEGLLRVAGAGALALGGVGVAGPYGLLIAAGPALALLLVAPSLRGVLADGPPASWSELSEALGWLLLGTALAQAFVNAPVPLVKVLAADTDAALAGQFQAGLIISRVPLFLFQAVQAALLPKLSSLAARRELEAFGHGVRQLTAVVVGIGVIATAGAFAVGPFVLRLFFGPEFDQLTNRDLGLMALASAAFMLATAISQALIALRRHANVALGWAVAVVIMFTVIAAVRDSLLLRVEVGLVAGALAAVAAFALLLRIQLGAARAAGSATTLSMPPATP